MTEKPVYKPRLMGIELKVPDGLSDDEEKQFFEKLLKTLKTSKSFIIVVDEDGRFGSYSFDDIFTGNYEYLETPIGY